MFNLIHYTIYRGELQPFTAPAYEYILAGNGLFLRAENNFVSALGLVQPLRRIRGLPDLKQRIEPKHGRIPGHLLATIAADMARYSREVMYILSLEEARVRASRLADQAGSPVGVTYQSEQYAGAIMDIHSHCNMQAFFSSTDNGDEQGFRWYGVIGRVYDRPEMRLRLGVHGYHFNAPLATLFTPGGGPTGVRDAFYPDPLEELEETIHENRD